MSSHQYKEPTGATSAQAESDLAPAPALGQRGNAAILEQLRSRGARRNWFDAKARSDDQGASFDASLLGLSDHTGSGGLVNFSASAGTTQNADGGESKGVSASGSLVEGHFNDGSGVTMMGGEAQAGTWTDGDGNSSTGVSFESAFMNGYDPSADVDVGNLDLFAGHQENADGSSFSGASASGGILEAELDNGATVDIGQLDADVGVTHNADASSFEGASADANVLSVEGAQGEGVQFGNAEVKSGVETDADGHETFVADGHAALWEATTGDAWEHGEASAEFMAVDVNGESDDTHQSLSLDLTPLAFDLSFNDGGEENRGADLSYDKPMASLDYERTYGDTNGDGIEEHGAELSTDLLGTKIGFGQETRTADLDGDGVMEEVGQSVQMGPLALDTGVHGDTDDDGMIEQGTSLNTKLFGMNMGLGYTTESGDTDGDGVEEHGSKLELGPLTIETGDADKNGTDDLAVDLGPLSAQAGDTDGDGQTDYSFGGNLAGLEVDYTTEDPLGDLVSVLNPFDEPGHDDDRNMTQSAIDTVSAVGDKIGDVAGDVKDKVGSGLSSLGSMVSGLFGGGD